MCSRTADELGEDSICDTFVDRLRSKVSRALQQKKPKKQLKMKRMNLMIPCKSVC